MTRHEKLQKAADRWADSTSFICGAYWADDNPKSPWISVEDDLPCNHKELIDKEINMTKRVLVLCKDEKSNITPDMMGMFFIENCWQWTCEIHFKVTHWMPIPNLPEEQETITKEKLL